MCSIGYLQSVFKGLIAVQSDAGSGTGFASVTRKVKVP